MLCALQALLQSMAPQYKFAVVVRIVEEILASAADGMLPLAPCTPVISDALELLTLPAMQIDVKKGLAVAAEDNLDEGGTQVQFWKIAVL